MRVRRQDSRCHSYLPVPSVSRPGSTPAGRCGSRPDVYLGDVLGVDVEGVEGLRRLLPRPRRTSAGCDRAVGEVVVEQQVERVLAVARALRGDRHLAAVRRWRSRDRAVHGGLELTPAVAASARRRRRCPSSGTCPCTGTGVAAAAQRLGVLVDDVAAGRGQRGREVGAAADQHVARERRRGRAAPDQARARACRSRRSARGSSSRSAARRPAADARSPSAWRPPSARSTRGPGLVGVWAAAAVGPAGAAW